MQELNTQDIAMVSGGLSLAEAAKKIPSMLRSMRYQEAVWERLILLGH